MNQSLMNQAKSCAEHVITRQLTEPWTRSLLVNLLSLTSFRKSYLFHSLNLEACSLHLIEWNRTHTVEKWIDSEFSFVSFYLWILICEFSFVNFHLWIFICEFSSVNFHLWISICEFSSLNFHLWVFICEFSFVNFHLWIFIYEFSFVNFHFWIFICEFSSMNFHLWIFIYEFLFMWDFQVNINYVNIKLRRFYSSQIWDDQ
jgi:hypothetical protein